MKTSIHTLAWDNISEKVIGTHKKVTEHFNLNVNYYHQNSPHGIWMKDVLNQSSDDVVGFLDIDCVPTNKHVVPFVQNYVFDNQTFLGITQCSSFPGPEPEQRYHIYAAPSFYFIYREKWIDLGCPGFAEGNNCDVGQCTTKTAEHATLPYQCLYPTHYDKPASYPEWRLSNYGYYGIGTHYQGGVYHLYESRNNNNIDLFVSRCDQIIDGTFSTSGMKKTFDIPYDWA